MYFTLFNKITDIITELEELQQQTEEMYIQTKEQEIILMKKDEQKRHFTK